jgi:hypothetical protein
MAKVPNYSELIVPETPVPSKTYNASTTTRTGFLEFKPRDMETQTKYDAMSPSWEGVESSMKAVERGDYALDSAETTRREARPVYAPSQTPLPPARDSDTIMQAVDSFLKRQPKPDGLVPRTCVIQ